MDPVRRPFGFAQLRHRALAGEDEDQVVRIDTLQARGLDQRPGAIDRRPTDVLDRERVAPVERVRQAARDVHAPHQPPFFGDRVERDADPHRAGRLCRRLARRDGDDLLAPEEVQRHSVSPRT